jgi:hypothetical protein
MGADVTSTGYRRAAPEYLLPAVLRALFLLASPFLAMRLTTNEAALDGDLMPPYDGLPLEYRLTAHMLPMIKA